MDFAARLRPYQLEAVARTLEHWGAGRLRVCVTLPTGAGKTTVAAALLAGARAPLALVHTTTLRDQTQRRLGPGVRVLTVQAALRLPRGALATHDTVFLDECHHLAAGRWRAVMDMLAPGARVVGCTATPERADGAPLGDLFTAMVAPVHYSALLRDGHLCPVRAVDAAGMDPASAYLAHGRGRPGILFAPTIAHCTEAVATLQAADVRAAAITAETPARDRARAFAAYDRDELDVLASPMALSEGFDAPRAEVCVLARRCAHTGLYLQTAGRVLRPHPAKQVALLVDCVGAVERHGLPTDDRVYSLKGTAIARREGPPRPHHAQYGAPTPRADVRPPWQVRAAERSPATAVARVVTGWGAWAKATWRALWV